ncbi:MAG TPA: ferritin [Candidatus Moranbacteria bacterium]|nr:ferritin [Candidatus Moranbacteria bacterium]
MKTYICQICGDAYLGHEKPTDCPFCGAHDNFIKEGKESNPIINQPTDISELSKKNLEETLALEIRANAIYLCMAGKADTYELKAMYKRLAKVELEHAAVVTKLMNIQMPEIAPQECSEDDVENFRKTIELEEHATDIYSKFAKEATEANIRIFFTALMQVEKDHIELIKNYL